MPQVAVEFVLKLSPPDRLAPGAVAERVSLEQSNNRRIRDVSAIISRPTFWETSDACGTSLHPESHSGFLGGELLGNSVGKKRSNKRAKH